MSEVKQVKVDNWGIFFLQRLKHFFNRTDYCDLTLQFQDNAQLKVHRLVLSACTEYFELLERTCEMYEDCLVMPDDLQADVVVPIINFMYTGQLEFRMDLLERLYQTSLVMNMPVLTKLLDAHRIQTFNRDSPCQSYSNPKRFKSYDSPKSTSASSSSSSQVLNNKRSYGKAFENSTPIQNIKKNSGNKSDLDVSDMLTQSNLISHGYGRPTPKKHVTSEPRPTRYELPEEMEVENLFDNSFTNISYTSKPLMVHPETTKHYPSKRTGIFEDPSTSKRFFHGRSSMDIVECKKISANDQIFGDDTSGTINDEQEMFPQRDSNQLFDQILDNSGPKVTIETKDGKQAGNLDHAKIISEVLKKYPHLVKSNKNIKLKILNTPTKKKAKEDSSKEEKEKEKTKPSAPDHSDYTFETEVIDSKEAAKLIALGAENIRGPWICLICGTPGKALHFTSYYKFRRHLVEVHNEKPIVNICEYCGQKSPKRNYLLHHLYTKHGVEPPPQYHFPKCNICSYVALTEAFLIKHKLSHSEKQLFRCNVCYATFSTSSQLLTHIQKTGHKYSADRKTNIQCIYCLKVFLRESNLYAHLRTYHKESAKNDGVIDVSDDEKQENDKEIAKGKSPMKQEVFKYEVPVVFKNEYEDVDVQYQIQQQPDGNIQVISKKPRTLAPAVKHKILNPGFNTPASNIAQKSKPVRSNQNKQTEILNNTNITINNQAEPEEIIMIDNNEYIVKDNRLYPKKDKVPSNDSFTMSIQSNIEETVHSVIPTTSVEFTNVQPTNPEEHKMIVKKPGSNINQPIQIVVSNEEEYKALMASNHSIIFEDGDAGKTLTVLTAPHDNNTTIDLDNTQSNEMMIIQDQFPLNVTDTVSGDNSNIVVVYSQCPVDDQNKEYQIITSESLGTQFVASSNIITQSYETVTTSAPVMSANILETPVEESWQNSIQQNIVSEVEMEIPSNQVTITPLQTEQSVIDERQDVQLTSDNTKEEVMNPIPEQVINQTTSITEQSEINNYNENIIIGGIQPNVSNNIESQANYPDMIDSSQSSHLNTIVNNQSVDETENFDQPNNEMKIDEDTPLGASNACEITESLNDQQNDTQDSADSETIENIAKEIESSAIMPINVLSDTEVHTSVVIESINNSNFSKAKEDIKNLTSEWSDDENECSDQDPNNIQEDSNSTNTKNTECETMDTDSQADLEESIENIQNEMVKQLSRPINTMAMLENEVPLAVTEEITSVLQNTSEEICIPQNTSEEVCMPQNSVDETIQKRIVPNEIIKTPVKIQTLLTDWEDNDSQDDQQPSTIENKGATDMVQDCVPTEEDIQKTNSINDTLDPDTNIAEVKEENIKNIVNNWSETEVNESEKHE